MSSTNHKPTARCRNQTIAAQTGHGGAVPHACGYLNLHDAIGLGQPLLLTELLGRCGVEPGCTQRLQTRDAAQSPEPAGGGQRPELHPWVPAREQWRIRPLSMSIDSKSGADSASEPQR